ncbi:ADP-ribosylation factor-like protein 9 [Aplochiton taeniatus]
MPGMREAGLVGAAIAVSGGVGYLIWTYIASSETEEQTLKQTSKPKKEPKKRDSIKESSAKEAIVASIAVPVVESQKAKLTEVKPAEKGKQVLVLGLEGAGKTSLLHCFASGSLELDVAPTQGFNAVSINREDLQIEFLEIGGKENLRAYWPRYLPKAMVLVFVVDSSDADHFPLARKHLHELLATDPLLPLVLLANKQDQQGACSITELHDALILAEVGDQRKLFLIGTHVRKGDTELNSGVQDARDLILQMVCEGR